MVVETLGLGSMASHGREEGVEDILFLDNLEWNDRRGRVVSHREAQERMAQWIVWSYMDHQETQTHKETVASQLFPGEAESCMTTL